MTCVLKSGVAVCYAPDSDNLGDHVQSLGLEEAVRAAFGEDCHIVRLRRDRVSLFSDPDVPVVVSGWVTHEFMPDFLPNRLGLFTGVHFTSYGRSAVKRRLDSGEKVFEYAVGGRDRSTVRWCESLGVPAYFNRCYGFCVPRPPLTGDKVFLVDVLPAYRAYLPRWDGAVEMSQRRWPCKGSVGQARAQLARYAAEARLVVTSALHVAVPCVSMGIPVVVLRPTDAADRRFETLDGLVPVNDVAACKAGSVDFDPKPVDITPLAADIVTNLRLSLMQHIGEHVDADELSAVRARISEFRG